MNIIASEIRVDTRIFAHVNAMNNESQCDLQVNRGDFTPKIRSSLLCAKNEEDIRNFFYRRTPKNTALPNTAGMRAQLGVPHAKSILCQNTISVSRWQSALATRSILLGAVLQSARKLRRQV